MLQGSEVDVVTIIRAIELDMFAMFKATPGDNHGVILHTVRALLLANAQGAGD